MQSQAGSKPSLRLLIASDKWKGSLSSSEINQTLANALQKRFPNLICECVAVSDGGEGLLAALSQWQTLRQLSIQVRDPLGRACSAQIGLVSSQGQRQLFAAAYQANGLQHLQETERDPTRTSSAGVADLLLAGVHHQVSGIYLGLGGSATCDGGLGALEALGFVFRDAEGQNLRQNVNQAVRLQQVNSIQAPASPFSIPISLLTDVSNPPIGPRGAARVFAPQKGATVAQVEALEAGMQNWVRVLENYSGRPLSDLKGGGAAGGLGLGLQVLLGASYVSGADWFIEAAEITQKLKRADFLITGEGRFDSSSLEGKVPGKLIALAKALQIKSVLVAGQITETQSPLANFSFALSDRGAFACGANNTRQLIQAWVDSLATDFWCKS